MTRNFASLNAESSTSVALPQMYESVLCLGRCAVFDMDSPMTVGFAWFEQFHSSCSTFIFVKRTILSPDHGGLRGHRDASEARDEILNNEL